MSSNRLPGKVMKKINGLPILGHVIRSANRVDECNKVVVCTSIDETDDLISDYCKSHGLEVYRGPLDNVYERYKGCILNYGFSAFGRICCDSPGISDKLISYAINAYKETESFALVTNVFNRSFPVGQSIEIVNSQVFLSPEYVNINGFSEEHVTQGFYKNYHKYKICSIEKIKKEREISWAVDEVEDLEVIKKLIKNDYDFNSEKVKTTLVSNEYN